MHASAIPTSRAAAIAATLDRIRHIAAPGFDREALNAIAEALVALANQAELFPSVHFPAPPPGVRGARRFPLSEDADHRFALGLNATRPGLETEPHEHTTWVAIAAIEGQELNRLYTRAQEGNDATLRLDREVVVEPGRGLGLMPDDIHAIRILGDRPARHLHLYGLALEHLPHRRAFDASSGAARPFPIPISAETSA